MRKPKGKIRKRIYYDFKALDWSASHNFGINYYFEDKGSERVGCNSSLNISCQIISPQIKNINYCNMVLFASFEFEKHLSQDTLTGKVNHIGFIQKQRGKDHITFYVSLPLYIFNSLHTLLGFNKTTKFSVFADELRYGTGSIYYVSFNENEYESTD